MNLDQNWNVARFCSIWEIDQFIPKDSDSGVRFGVGPSMDPWHRSKVTRSNVTYPWMSQKLSDTSNSTNFDPNIPKMLSDFVSDPPWSRWHRSKVTKVKCWLTRGCHEKLSNTSNPTTFDPRIPKMLSDLVSDPPWSRWHHSKVTGSIGDLPWMSQKNEWHIKPH